MMESRTGVVHPLRHEDVLIDEISLEGLDGITLAILWFRLENSKHWFLKPLDNDVKKFVWSILVQLSDVQWYKIRNPRPCPYAVGSKKFLASVRHIYAHKMIHDRRGIRGSCPEFETREDVSDMISALPFEEMCTKYTTNIVAVASQERRESALFSMEYGIIDSFPDLSYCMLERIGRARDEGLLSMHMDVMNVSANPAFYYWKKLEERKLIMVQSYSMYEDGKNKACKIFHLPRFYQKVTRKLEASVWALIDYLRLVPKNRVELSVIKKNLNLPKPNQMKRYNLFKNCVELKTMPYREVYPNAPKSEYLTQHGSERVLRMYILTNDPEVKDAVEAPISNEEDMTFGDSATLHRNVLIDSLQFINEQGAKGILQRELAYALGFKKYCVRTVINRLLRMGLIRYTVQEHYRQKVFRYYSVEVNDKKEEEIKLELCKTQKILKADSNTKNVAETENTSMTVSKTKVFSKPSSTREAKLSTKTGNKNRRAAIRLLRKKAIGGGLCLRPIRRSNLILEKVYREKVVFSYIPLLRHIKLHEAKEGYDVTVCRRTLKTLLGQLEGKGQIVIYKKIVVSQVNGRSRDCLFICKPDIEQDHPIILSTLEQIMVNLSISSDKKRKPVDDSSDRKTPPREEVEKEPTLNIANLEPTSGKRYGYGPKFGRMKFLHEVLFYIAYAYEGRVDLSQSDARKFVMSTSYGPTNKYDRLPQIYKCETSWKMFIPPLNTYEDRGEGWLTVADLVFRLPLFIFLSVVNITCVVPGLDERLEDPVQRNLLIQQLPSSIRNILIFKRRFLSRVMTSLQNLCMIGLVQFGDREANESSTTFIYVNRKTQLLDTTTCPVSSCEMRSDIKYEKKFYNFDTLNDVENYWNDAMVFCISTKLKVRRKTEGKAFYKFIMSKDSIREALKPRSASEALALDNGHVPGDRLGAAGYDSLLFAHMQHGWIRRRAVNARKSGLFNKYMTTPTVLKRPNKHYETNVDVTTKIVDVLSSDSVTARARGTTRAEQNIEQNTMTDTTTPDDQRESYTAANNNSNNKTGVTRKRRLINDETDLNAIRKMDSMRSYWTKHEDNILLLGYSASLYVKCVRVNYPYHVVMRQILHRCLSESSDKTSEAIRRRTKILRKNPHNENCTHFCLRSLHEDNNVENNFRDTREKIRRYFARRNTEKVFELMDKSLVVVFDALYAKFPDFYGAYRMYTTNTDRGEIPKSLEEFKARFTYEIASDVSKSNKNFSFPCSNEDDVIRSVIKSLIYSALFTQKASDKNDPRIIYELEQIFKQFSEANLQASFVNIRQLRMLAFSKPSYRLKNPTFLPVEDVTYHLSYKYHLLFRCSCGLEIYNEAYHMYKKLLSTSPERLLLLDRKTRGANLVLMEFFTKIHYINDQLKMGHDSSEHDRNGNFETEGDSGRNGGNATVYQESNHVDAPTSGSSNRSVVDNIDSQITVIEMDDDGVDYDFRFLNDDDNFNDDFDKVDYNVGGPGDTDSNEDYDDISDLEPNVFPKVRKYNKSSRFSVWWQSRYNESKVLHFPTNLKPLKCFLKNSPDRIVFYKEIRERTLDKIERSAVFHRSMLSDQKIILRISNYFPKSDIPDLRRLLEFILKKEQLGATASELKKNFSIPFLVRGIEALMDFNAILKSGINETRYIHREYSRCWLMRYISIPPSGSTSSSPISNNAFKQMEAKTLYVLMRPWIHYNGTVNYDVLYSMLCRILLNVYEKGSFPIQNVFKQYAPALLPQHVRELLEILRDLGVIQLMCVTENTHSPLSNQREMDIIDEATGFEDDDVVFIEVDKMGFTKMCIFIGDKNMKNDLLFVKSSNPTKNRETNDFDESMEF